MRGSETDKLARRYDLGLLPESGKMFLIAGHQIIRSGSIGAFQEYVVSGIRCHVESPSRRHRMAVILDELKQLQPEPLSDPELGTGEHFVVFLKDGLRNI